jgi:hypothetical protein
MLVQAESGFGSPLKSTCLFMTFGAMIVSTMHSVQAGQAINTVAPGENSPIKATI